MRFLKFILPLLLVTTNASASFFLPDGAVTTAKLSVTAINGLTTVTAASGDSVAISDLSDSNKNKKALVSDFKNATYRSVTTTDAVGADDETMKLSGSSFTSTLPTAVGVAGKRYKFIHAGTSLSNVYTLATTSAQTIGGIASGSYALYTNGESLSIESDGANWIIINHYARTASTNVGATTFTATSAYVFTLASSASITAGTVYTNNGATFIVSTTTSSSTTLTCSGTGAPGASGTLTFVSGSPSGNLTFNSKTTTGQPVKGVLSSDAFWYEREGNKAHIRILISQTANTNHVNGVGDYIWFMPANMVIDTGVHSVFTTIGSGPVKYSELLGTVTTWTDTPNANSGGVSVYNSGSFRMILTSTSNGVIVGAANLNFSTTTQGITADFWLNILGWQP